MHHSSDRRTVPYGWEQADGPEQLGRSPGGDPGCSISLLGPGFDKSKKWIMELFTVFLFFRAKNTNDQKNNNDETKVETVTFPTVPVRASNSQ